MFYFAPVLILTLNRFEHFKRCIDSLLCCTYSENTDVYIALDYPLNDKHWEGYVKIQKYLSRFIGFESINVIKRKANYGVSRNYYEACNEIFNIYDRMILSEDDNECSPNFLEYIKNGLEKFKDNYSIYAICGYNYPINNSALSQNGYCSISYSVLTP